jgi:uncharacterized protein (TIGR00369 family)
MTDDDGREARRRERRLALARTFADNVPHNHALGIVIEDMGDRSARFRLPYALRLVGNPDTGVLHGGVITALLDACCGAAVFASLPHLQPIATLDLRIDYLRPAEPGRDVWAEAVCHHVTSNVAFVRASAYHAAGEVAIASAAGTFMIATKLTAAPARSPSP